MKHEVNFYMLIQNEFFFNLHQKLIAVAMGEEDQGTEGLGSGQMGDLFLLHTLCVRFVDTHSTPGSAFLLQISPTKHRLVKI